MSYKDNIERIMRAKGVSQVELGNRLGISSQAVNQWFNTPGGPKSSRFPEIAKALGVALSELLEPEGGAARETPEEPFVAAPSAASPKAVWRAIGNRLNFVRTARMMSDLPEAVASRLGIKPSDLLAYESGEQPTPLEVIVAFCHKFAVSADFLLLGKEDRLDDYLRDRLPKKART